MNYQTLSDFETVRKQGMFDSPGKDTFGRPLLPTNQVQKLFTAVKSNPRAMDILLDELAISDRAMPGTHRFIRG
jgi:hypothetical protein